MGVEHHRKTPWEIAEGWYSVDDIHRSLNRIRDPLTGERNNQIPEDVTSREFSEWLTHLYRLAMAKGVQLGRDCSEDGTESLASFREPFTSPRSGMGDPEVTTDAMKHFDTDDLIMSTAAYYLTTNVGDFCQRLRRAWPELSEDVRSHIRRLVESQFAREGVLRRLYVEPDWTLFGDDRDEWVAVRNLWAIKTEERVDE